MAGGFRLFLALLVVNEHVTRNMNFGGYAVNSFFVLSGFWVTKMWRFKYRAYLHPAPTFWLSRLWRIYPAFIIAVGACALVRREVPPLSALNPLSPSVSEWLAPAWSLGPELEFYLIAPFVVAVLARHTLASLCALAVSAICSMVFGYRGFPTYAIFFAIGSVSAMHSWMPSRSFAFGSAIAGVAMATASWRSPALRPLFFSGPGETGFAIFADAFLAVMTVPFALWTTRQRSLMGDRFLGDLSYTLYLIHWPIVSLYQAASSSAPSVWALSLVAAVILLGLEMPSEMARERLLKALSPR